MCMYACVDAGVCGCVGMHVRMYGCVHVCVGMSVCVRGVCVCRCVCMCMCVCVYVFICVYVNMYGAV